MFDKLKSLFVVEDETAPKKKQQKAAPKKPGKTTKQPAGKKPQPSTPTPKPAPRPSSAQAGGEVTEKFTTTLLKAIEANNIEGFDYIEYKQAIQSMSEMAMDEATRYKSAYAMAKTMGASSEHLIKAAKFYVSVLGKEEEKFMATLQRQVQQRVGQRHEQVKALEQAIGQKNQQIEQLKKEIEDHKKLLDKTNGEVAGVQDKLNLTKNNFEASYVHIRKQLEDDIQKMTTYLSE